MGNPYQIQLEQNGGPVTFDGEATFTDPDNQPGGIASWGLASQAHFVGDGSPSGVVTPTAAGDLYVDNTTPALYQATGTGDTDWQLVGGGSQPITGDGDPGGVVTPTSIGQLYIDTTGGGLYISTGLVDTDWLQVGGVLGGVSPGFSVNGSTPRGFDGNFAASLVAGENGFGGSISIPGIIVGQGAASYAITSGALPQTGAWTSGTPQQALNTRDAFMAFDFVTDGTTNAASCVIALSPDGTTYTDVATVGCSAAVNTVGAVTLSGGVQVPAGWYVKLTYTHGTPSVGTYY